VGIIPAKNTRDILRIVHYSTTLLTVPHPMPPPHNRKKEKKKAKENRG